MKSEEIGRLLPAVFQRTLGNPPDVLGALLKVMQEMHDPSEKILAELDRYFLPDRTDDAYLLFLARWVDLDWLAPADGLPAWNSQAQSGPKYLIEFPRLRRLIQSAVSLHRQRGTRDVLLRFLEIATGDPGFSIREDPHRPFHILVFYPLNANPELARRIVEWERPVYVTYELCQRWTLAALPQFLRIETGVEGFAVRQDPGAAAHWLVFYPQNANLELAQRILEREKPANVTAELRRRWTLDALLQFLRIDAGAEGFTILKNPDRPGQILVDCPRNANLERVRRIVEREKPANVSYQLIQAAQDMPAAEGVGR